MLQVILQKQELIQPVTTPVTSSIAWIGVQDIIQDDEVGVTIIRA